MKLLSVKLIHQEDTKMRKFLSLFLAGCLIFLLPATIWASAETTYESEQGQAMIKAPSSSVFGSGDSTDSADDADSSDSDSSEGDEDTVSSGIDWLAANTASRATSDRNRWLPALPRPKTKRRPAPPATIPKFRNTK